MQALTRKPLIDNGSRVLVISCPEEKYESLVAFLRKNDCEMRDEDEDMPACAVFPARTPGTVLRGLRYRDSLTQVDLSKLAGIPRRHISEMENGKRPIGRQTARKLAEVLNTDPRMFLSA